MQLEVCDPVRGWVKVGETFGHPALSWVVKGCDLLIAHAQVQFRVRGTSGRVVMQVEGGRWVKPGGDIWRASAWSDLDGFEDTVGVRR